MSEFERLSNTEGFTVVRRIGKKPRVHLIRPFESCNTDDAPHKDRFAGSAEVLMSRHGRTIPCLRCFPGPQLEEQALQAARDEAAGPARGSFSPEELAQQVGVSASAEYVDRNDDEEVAG